MLDLCLRGRLNLAEAAARIEELSTFLGLTEKLDAKVVTLSGGFKRRMQIARGLLGEPEVLVLDEPTTGLDPQARQHLWERLNALKRKQATLLLTTHYLDEAQQLCDRLVVMHLGRILAEGSPDELIKQYVGDQVLELRLTNGQRQEAVELLQRHDGVRLEEVEDSIYAFGPTQQWQPILDTLTPFGKSVRLREATLEDVFLQLTGRGLTE